MSRRKQSAFEDLIEITSKLPWWVGVVLAVGFYIGLHQIAVMEVIAPTSTKGMADFAGKQLYKTLAIFGQYVLPAAFLFGALISVFSRHKRNALHAQVATSGKRSALEQMSWQEFEQLVGEFFRRKGFAVEETGGGGADGGVDLVVRLGKDRYLVQCKQWKARQVGVSVVRELYGVMAAKGAAGGFVVTSGVFTEEARSFVEGREIEIITGDQLLQEIRITQAPAGIATIPANSSANAAPACPQCGATMIMRTARKGANAGNPFWGCSTFPKCHGTRPG